MERVILNEDGSATLRLRHVRLSFPALFTPKENEGDNGTITKKFGASFIFPRTGDEHENLKFAKQAVDHCVKTGLKGRDPGPDRKCLRSGASKPDLDGYGDDVAFISASSKDRPQVVDRACNPLVEEDGKVYGGCYVNATVRLWAQDNKFGKRVNAQLKAVQFDSDGDPFGAPKVNVEDEFSDTREQASSKASTPSVDDGL